MPQSLRLIRSFLVLSCTAVAAVVLATFVSYHLRTERLTKEILLQQARALFDEVIITHQWVSEHGGVYVKVKPGIDPNPFLTTLPGLAVNITDQEGQPLYPSQSRPGGERHFPSGRKEGRLQTPCGKPQAAECQGQLTRSLRTRGAARL